MHDAEELCDRVAFIVGGELKLIEAPKTLKLQAGQRTVKVEYGPDGSAVLELPLDGLADSAEFLRVLREERIQAIHSQEATLEKVFVEATGARIE